MKIVTFGEIMLRLTPATHGGKLSTASHFGVDFAGSESNVSSSLAVLGEEVSFVTKLPTGPIGDHAIQSLQKYGISTSDILRSEGRMGTYFIEIGSSIRPSSVVYDRADSAFSCLKKGEFDWVAILEETSWIFVSGITAALSSDCAQELIDLVRTAKNLGVKVSFDMNYRRKLWNDASEARKIFDPVLEHTDLLFGNEGSLTDVYGLSFEGETVQERAVEAIASTQKEFGIPTCAFTSRIHHSATKNELQGFYGSDEGVVSSGSYEVEILDRFGTGDAFAAGCLHGLAKGWESKKVVNFGAAAFALKHTIYGDQHVSTEEEILSIMDGHITGHVLR